MLRHVIFVAIFLLSITLIGCGSMPNPHQERVLALEDLAGAQALEAFLEMGVGQMHVESGGELPFRLRAAFYVEDWDPRFDYDVSDGIGTVMVAQPDVDRPRAFINVRNEWTVQLGRDVPLSSLDMTLGVGMADMKIGDLALEHLRFKLGVGQATLDLGGFHRGHLEAIVEAGVGQCRIILPKGVGLRVEVDRGVTHLAIDGLQREGDAYVSEDHDVEGATIDMNIKAGVGQVVVIVQD